ncbi:colicin V processing peptidase [Hephaestia caeni]|uniref:Colicin V processing peptidase n=1 Tax=Hephaestia caeni TaxID=645617 RepID=A0A397P9D4_9SPHN|nr:peptidase domain-containing ABC transporter [Hephaestia caeni]RIA45682.1 colicin V processing peptidase [Hephaestia caeni]
MSDAAALNLSGRARLPYIPQSEASECALACLAMVAGFHGYKTDLVALRQRFGLSLKGATLGQVIRVAEAIGFNCRPLRGEIEEFDKMALPAILHWNLNHFVVLAGIERRVQGVRYIVHDPARGVLKLSGEEVSRSFTGVALELLKSAEFVPGVEKTKFGVRQLWSSISGFWSVLKNVLILSAVIQLATLALPFLMQVSVDSVVPSSDRDLLLVLALGFGGLGLIKVFSSWVRSLAVVSMTNSLSYQVIVNLYRHLLRLPLQWFERRHIGDIVSRFGSTQPITQLVSDGMVTGLIDGVMTLATLTLMVIYAPLLALVTSVLFAFYAGLRLAFLSTLRLKNIDAITAAAREQSAFIESVRGIAAIKAFGQEGNRQRLWQRTKADAVNAQIKLERTTAGFDGLGQLVLIVEQIAFVYLGIGLVLDGALSLGMLFAFQAYKTQFLDASMRLIEQLLNYKIMQVHLARVADVALSKQEDANLVANVDRPDFSQELELRNVHFRYGFGEQSVLKGVNLTIRPGEMLALIGPSGGGKTTLMKIMMGLFEPFHGEVLVGGRSIKSFSKHAYRQAIGSVSQDDQLYAGSIAENIAFFDSEIDMARVEEVAKLAAVHDEINAMPLRYDSLIGDMGSVLSGGQKQRVLLARALYGRPAILFMDEGTAHLDPENEAKVLEALSRLSITRIVIAHRQQSIEAADRVMTVSKGLVHDKAAGSPTLKIEV